MTRPHVHATTSELKVLYEEDKHTAQVVDSNSRELKHRSRTAAKRLAKRIQDDRPAVAAHVEQRKGNERSDSTDDMMVRLEGEATALQVAAFVALERIKDRGSAAGDVRASEK